VPVRGFGAQGPGGHKQASSHQSGGMLMNGSVSHAVGHAKTPQSEQVAVERAPAPLSSRLGWPKFVTTLAIVLLGWQSVSVAQPLEGNLRRSMGNLRPPSPQTGLQRAAPAPSGYNPGSERYMPHRHHLRDSRWYYHRYDYCWPYPGWYSPAVPYWSSFVYVAPIYLPGELLFGPQATARFMGAPQFRFTRRSEPRYVIVVQPPPEQGKLQAAENQARPAEGQPAAEPAPVQPRPNRQAEATARRFIAFGDAHFRAQRFAEAYRRYKRAAEVAPGSADAWFRQGLALVAIGNFAQAASVWKKGLELQPQWPQAGFRLRELYQGIEPAKLGHVDAVVAAAMRKCDQADLLFVAGVMLYFDGQEEQARAFFEEALTADDSMARYVQPFLNAIPPAEGPLGGEDPPLELK